MDSIEHGAANVVGEAFDELIGRSKRSWALTLVAFVLGAAATAVIVIKGRAAPRRRLGRPNRNRRHWTPLGTQASEAHSNSGVDSPARRRLRAQTR